MYSIYIILKFAGQPDVTVTPFSQSVEVTLTAKFIATVKGVGPFTYQWRRGNNNITNENHSTLVIREVAMKDQRFYRCYVTNLYGDSAVSNKAFLQVTSKYYTCMYN